MNRTVDSENVYRLSMNEFVPPDRRMDAFPSVRYEVPPAYLADTLALKYMADSAATIQIESHTVYVEAGDLLLIAPYAAHRVHPMRSEARVINVVFRPARVAEALPRLFAFGNPIRDFLAGCTQPSGPLFLHLPVHDLDFDRAFFELASDYCTRTPRPDPVRLLLLENHLERILLTLLEDPAIQSQKAELSDAEAGSLSRILGYIQRHLDRVTLREAADELGWNASHLSRYIKRRTGRAFTDIVQVLRMDEASVLLTRGDCTVEEAMTRVGYAGKANFYAVFQRRFGCTPAQYRRAWRERAAQGR